jgi:hypothetical protein
MGSACGIPSPRHSPSWQYVTRIADETPEGGSVSEGPHSRRLGKWVTPHALNQILIVRMAFLGEDNSTVVLDCDDACVEVRSWHTLAPLHTRACVEWHVSQSPPTHSPRPRTVLALVLTGHPRGVRERGGSIPGMPFTAWDNWLV